MLIANEAGDHRPAVERPPLALRPPNGRMVGRLLFRLPWFRVAAPKATPVLGWRRMGEAAAALIASVQLLSPSLLPPLTSHLLKELRENFNSGVTRLAVPTYKTYYVLHVMFVKTRSIEADEECDDKELDVELLHEREEVPTIKVSAIRPPGALRKNERALDRMNHDACAAPPRPARGAQHPPSHPTMSWSAWMGPTSTCPSGVSSPMCDSPPVSSS
jgi:hypothetical protein